MRYSQSVRKERVNIKEKKFNQNGYINDYKKSHYKRYMFEVKKDLTQIIEKLESVPNKGEYIRQLIEQDIKQHTK